MRHRTPVIYGTALALALSVVWLVGGGMTGPVKDDPVFFREIVGYERQGEVVQYQYKGERLPNTLAPDEDVNQRTDTSYVRLLGIEKVGTPQETRTYEGVFYAQPAFVQEGSEWYYREYATTTEVAFNAVRAQNLIASLFWQEVYAANATVYSGSGDGYVLSSAFASEEGTLICQTLSWSEAHDETVGDSANTTDTFANVSSGLNNEFDSETFFCSADAYIYRAFLPFDTSSLPSNATVSAATLTIYVTSKIDQDNDGSDYLTVVRTDQGTHTALTTSDADNAGALDNPTEGIDAGERKDITSITTSAALTFTLNATGISWVAKSGQASNCSATNGISCFGIREGHDTTDSRPIANSQTGINLSTSEHTGTSQDPYLSITYTAPASFSFWQFQDF